jgi:hypothetical protein
VFSDYGTIKHVILEHTIGNALPSDCEITIGNVLFSRICWSTDPSMSHMAYYGFKHKSGALTELHRGAWAGDRFEFRTIDEKNVMGFVDITSDIYHEVEAMWQADGYEFEMSPSSDKIGPWFTGKYGEQLWACEPLPTYTNGNVEELGSLSGLKFSASKTNEAFNSTVPVNISQPVPDEILAEVFFWVLRFNEPMTMTNSAKEPPPSLQQPQ